jgi:membrane protease YdiL (CAAX protease family)
MPTLYRWVAALLVLSALLRLDGAYGSHLYSEELLWIAAFAALIGVNEELLFRGIWLRSMRVSCRGEGRAVIYTCAAFGIFHVANIVIGEPGSGIEQVLGAAVIGIALYLWRRGTTWIFPAMLVHGLWDYAFFVNDNDFSPPEPGNEAIINLVTLAVFLTSVIAAQRLWKGEGMLVWQRAGTRIDNDAPLVRIDPALAPPPPPAPPPLPPAPAHPGF